MKEEIFSGLKNAIERGFSLESAVQSFINAGYNEAEVKEAASAITMGATSIMAPAQPTRKIEQKSSFFSKNKNLEPILEKQKNELPPIESKIQSIEPKIQQIENKNQSLENKVPLNQNLNAWEGEPQVERQQFNQISPTLRTIQSQRPPKKSKIVILLLLLIPIFLMAILGILGFIIFKDQITNFITGFS